MNQNEVYNVVDNDYNDWPMSNYPADSVVSQPMLQLA